MFNFDSDVLKGDWVMYYSHPGSGVSYPALVVHKGNDSIECIVYSWNGAVAAASHKSGVRHVENPVFNDPVIVSNLLADGDSGCFTLHPNAILVKQLLERIEELESKVLKVKKAKPVVVEEKPEVKPDLSFRMDNGDELTDEQKAERKAILAGSI